MIKPTLSTFLKSALLLVSLCAAAAAFALSFGELTNRDATNGLKAALEKGTAAAVGKLGVEDGFMGNEKVKIPLPRILEQAKPLLKMTGRAQQLDDLELAMNRAAESAVPLAKPLLLNAVKSMTVTDAKNILTGGDTSVTTFFRDKTAAQLGMKFLPIVKSVTDRSGLSSRYNKTMAQVGKFSNVPEQQASVEAYVTQRALDGLFYMIGEEERAIRSDPIGTGSKIIGKVFGALN